MKEQATALARDPIIVSPDPSLDAVLGYNGVDAGLGDGRRVADAGSDSEEHWTEVGEGNFR